MNDDQNKSHWLAHPAWAGIGAIAGILALCLGIFTYLVPNSVSGGGIASPTVSSIATPVTNPSPPKNNQQEDRIGKTFDSIRSLWFLFLVIGFIPLFSLYLYISLNSTFSIYLKDLFYFILLLFSSEISSFATGFLAMYFWDSMQIWTVLILSLVLSSIVFYCEYALITVFLDGSYRRNARRSRIRV